MKPAKQILLVEDQPMDAQLIQMILTDQGLSSVEAVGDGGDALDYLHRRGDYSDRVPMEPALVFLDLKMPRTSGWEVLSEIKNHPCLRTVPVVILTSSGDANDVQRAYELGANAYLVKQIDFDRYADMLATTARFWLGFNRSPPGCMQAKE